jgi:chromosome segregation ATPase
MSNELSSLKNKFKAMQINLDSQKEQIDAKDKSIFALRAKIKELEEQNADLKSQFEKQSTLNKRFDAFVQSLQSVNNVLHDDLR